MNEYINGQDKRGKFREEIRRKQIDTMFKKRRQNGLLLHNKDLHQTNRLLMSKSLVKNALLYDVNEQALLQRLHNKIKDNSIPPNIQFVVALCSNLLGDDLKLVQKQYIYEMCHKNVRGVVSIGVEIYYYRNLILHCYQQFECSDQEKIQLTVLPRTIQILIQCQKQEQKEKRQEITLEVLQTLQQYFCEDKDHNKSLIYKLRRNDQIISDLIDWNLQLKEGTCMQFIVQLLKIYENISTCSLERIVKPQKYDDFFRVVKLPLSFPNKTYEVREKVYNILINLVEANTEIDILKMNQIEALVDQLQKTMNFHQAQLTQRLKLIKKLIEIKMNTMQKFFYSLMSGLCETISLQHTGKGEVLMICLQILSQIFKIGFDEGNSEYTKYFKGIGGERVLDESNKQKIVQINEVIEQVQYYLDFQ